MSDTHDEPPTFRFLPHQDLQHLGSDIQGLILSLQTIDKEAVATLSAEEKRALVAELAPPALLFSPQTSKFRAIYADMRALLSSMGAPLEPHQSRRHLLTITHNLYEPGEERDLQLPLRLRQRSTRHQTPLLW